MVELETLGGNGGQQVHGLAFGFARRTAVAGPCTVSTGALWKCPAWGRPVNIALNLKVGEAGAPSPLEISRAIRRRSRLCPGREIPTLPQRSSSMTDTERRSSEDVS